MAKPPVTLDLTWTGDLAFRADAGHDRHIVTDGNSRAGLSPMELLGVATAACMAVDVVHILTRSRQDVRGLRAHIVGGRAETEPHRFVAVRLEFDIDGAVSLPQLDRAVRLSRDKYCSVWNSLRADIALDVVTRVHAPAAAS
jgi:putative redox protein